MLKAIRLYFSIAGIKGVMLAIWSKITRKTRLLQVSREDVKFPIFLRTPSSDAAVFHQIFINQEYNFDTKRSPGIIVDAGANIGLSAIYFSNKFPEAKVIAIEPEKNNLELLKRNVLKYENIISVSGAVWNKNEKINLLDPGTGSWGFMTQGKNDNEKHGKNIYEVQGMTIDRIIKEQGIDHIDILKIDIEGAEREVFKDTSAWIRKVNAIVIELHENMKPGCYSSFYRGTDGFDNEWRQGEFIYLARNNSCLVTS